MCTVFIMANKSTPKRKTTTLETEYKAMLEVETGKKTKTAIAKELNIPLNTISTWIGKSDYYKDAYQKQEFGVKVKRLKKGNYEDIEDALDQWMRNARSRNLIITGPIIKEKAEELAKEMGHHEFKASNGWLDQMKVRKDLKFRAIKGEAKSVPTDAVDAWRNTLLPQLLQEYSPDNIYNADETGLFYKLMPNKSLVYKDEDGRGGKLSKERVTVLPTVNKSTS